VARGCCALRDMTDELLRKRLPNSTAVGHDELLEQALEEHVYRTIAELFGKEDGIAGGAAAACTLPTLRWATWGERHCGRRRAHRHGAAMGLRYRQTGGGVLLCRGWRLLQRRGSGIVELGGTGAIHQ